MNSSDITNTVIIIIIFALINIVSILGSGVDHIEIIGITINVCLL